MTQRRRLLDLLWPMLQMLLLDLLRQALLHLISLDIERAFKLGCASLRYILMALYDTICLLPLENHVPLKRL
jgi:hypothetical protein